MKLDERTKERLLDRDLIPESITIGGKSFVVHDPVGAGVTGVVWKCRDEHGRERAVKLALGDRYDKASYREEMARAGRLEQYSEFATLYDAGIAKVVFRDGEDGQFVAFVEEWVNGDTLKSILDAHEELHVISLLRAFVQSFCSVLAALETKRLRHDDLNPRNVMITPPREGDLDPCWSVKIIDLASLKPASKPTRKPRDDHRWFVEHLVALWNAIHRRNRLSIRDRRFMAEAERLLGSMLDEDPTIRLTDPQQIYSQFNEAFTRSQSSRLADDVSLRDPFDFISAEHIWDDRLLVRLFAQSCPWLDKVSGPDPCLVTGPRGCGKSMIFRWLSLKAQLLAHPNWSGKDFNVLQISGFYISCSSDLQNQFAWVKTADRAAEFENEIVHYFNLLAAREILQTLNLIARREDRDSYWGLGVAQERAIHRFVMECVASEASRRIQGVSLLEQSLDVVEGEIFETHALLARRGNMDRTTQQSFLGDFTHVLTAELPIFRDRRMTFLVDDFSVHRISEHVQFVLNRVIWERRDTHVFKLSSEKYGAMVRDESGATADLARELVEIDCGQALIALNDKAGQAKALRFTEELLDNRLNEAGYKGTADTLIGPSDWAGASLGRALREKASGRSDDQYHGMRCIAELFSGDVATLLLVYRRMFSSSRVTEATTTRIPKWKQHAAIRHVSQRMFEQIRTYHPYGPEMYELVNHFGTFVRRVLDEGRMIKQGSAHVPPQCPRIEIDQEEGAIPDQLSESQRRLARELVRRAIFIEMEPGLSRHESVTTLRWQLRRVLLPAFNAALSKNTAVKEDPDWLKYFLSNPKEALETVWAKWRKHDESQKQFPFEAASGEP